MASLLVVKPKKLALATFVTTALVAGVAAAPAMATFPEVKTFVAPGPLTAEQENALCRPAPVNCQITDVIARGHAGSHVRQLQRALNASEHDVQVAVDGVFGPETEAGVRKVQADHNGLVDGIVGSQTVSFIADAIDSDGDGVPDSRE